MTDNRLKASNNLLNDYSSQCKEGITYVVLKNTVLFS